MRSAFELAHALADHSLNVAPPRGWGILTGVMDAMQVKMQAEE